MKCSGSEFSSDGSVNLIRYRSLESKSFDDCIKNNLTQSLDHIAQDIESEASYCPSFSSSTSGQHLDFSGTESYGYGSLSNCQALFNSSSQCLPQIISNKYETREWPSSWDSMFNLADNILWQWEEGSRLKKSKLNRTIEIGLICPMSSLENVMLLCPGAKLYLRRHSSEINLNQITTDCESFNTQVFYDFYKNRRKSEQSIDFLDYSLFEKWNQINLKENEKSSVIIENESESFEMKHLKSQNLNDWSPQTKSRLLIKKIIFNDPISVAMQLTTIDKDLYLQMKPFEIVYILLGKPKKLKYCNLNGVKTILEFGEQIKNLIHLVINRECSSEAQARKIAAFIEVACVLRKLRNWSSLNVVIKALQAPEIYILESAWMNVRSLFTTHFNDFKALSILINKFDGQLQSFQSGKPYIPCLKMWIKNLRIQCSAKVDRYESRIEMFECPNLSEWIEKESKDLIDKSKIFKTSKQVAIASLCLCNFTLLPQDDPVRFTSYLNLPFPWTSYEVRNILSMHQKRIIFFTLDLINHDLKLVSQYKMKRYLNKL